MASPDPPTRGQLIGPVTTAGAAVAALAAGSYVAGWRLGWIELLVVAGACLIALLLAIPFVIGRSRLRVERRLSSDRIEVGEHVDVGLHVINEGRTHARRVDLDELIGERVEVVPVPSLPPGAAHEHDYRLQPTRRSRLHVGPAVVTRSDPLGLLRRRVAQSDATTCWVYPRTRVLAPCRWDSRRTSRGQHRTRRRSVMWRSTRSGRT